MDRHAALSPVPVTTDSDVNPDMSGRPTASTSVPGGRPGAQHRGWRDNRPVDGSEPPEIDSHQPDHPGGADRRYVIAERLEDMSARTMSRAERARAGWLRAAARANRARATYGRTDRQDHTTEGTEVSDARDRAADERERIADERDEIADTRERIADIRERATDRRESDVDQREADSDELSLRAQIVAFRREAAERADWIAEQAEKFATYFENAAGRGDTERRQRLAEIEREIAGIERRNAAKLRGPDDWPLDLEHLPRFPVDDLPTD